MDQHRERESPSLDESLADSIAGDSHATERLLAELYDELHAMAKARMRRERAGHILQPTALVNEAFVRLSGPTKANPQSRQHFLALAATAMRNVLRNHARDRQALKRGGDAQQVSMTGLQLVTTRNEIDILAFSEALDKLTNEHPRRARVVTLVVLGGLEQQEIATLLDVSERTVRNDWKYSRAWIQHQMRDR